MTLYERLHPWVTPGTMSTEAQRRNLRAWMLKYRVGMSPWVRLALNAQLPVGIVGGVGR